MELAEGQKRLFRQLALDDLDENMTTERVAVRQDMQHNQRLLWGQSGDMDVEQADEQMKLMAARDIVLHPDLLKQQGGQTAAQPAAQPVQAGQQKKPGVGKLLATLALGTVLPAAATGVGGYLVANSLNRPDTDTTGELVPVPTPERVVDVTQ